MYVSEEVRVGVCENIHAQTVLEYFNDPDSGNVIHLKWYTQRKEKDIEFLDIEKSE